jgi:hypothetical protein
MVSGENTADEPLAPGFERLTQHVHLRRRQVLGPVGFSAVGLRLSFDVAGEECEGEPVGVSKVLDAEKRLHFHDDAAFLEGFADGGVGGGFPRIDEPPWNTPLTLQRMTRTLTHPKDALVLS